MTVVHLATKLPVGTDSVRGTVRGWLTPSGRCEEASVPDSATQAGSAQEALAG